MVSVWEAVIDVQGWAWWGYVLLALGIGWLLLNMKTSRPDGTYLKTIHPYRKMIVALQPTRTESQVSFEIAVKADPIIAYMEKAKERFEVDFTHCMVAGVTISLMHTKEINRFIAGRRMYQRSEPSITFAAKRKRLNRTAALAAVKVPIDDTESFQELCARVESSISYHRSGVKTYNDKEFALLNAVPRSVMSFGLRVLRWMDAHNILPGAFIRDDVTYTSVYLANLGSIGMGTVAHHLFEWGNCPIFLAAGAVEERPVVVDGEIEVQRLIPVTFMFDDRITDALNAWIAIQAGVIAFENPEEYFGCLDDDDVFPLGSRLPTVPHQDGPDGRVTATAEP